MATEFIPSHRFNRKKIMDDQAKRFSFPQITRVLTPPPEKVLDIPTEQVLNSTTGEMETVEQESHTFYATHKKPTMHGVNSEGNKCVYQFEDFKLTLFGPEIEAFRKSLKLMAPSARKYVKQDSNDTATLAAVAAHRAAQENRRHAVQGGMNSDADGSAMRRIQAAAVNTMNNLGLKPVDPSDPTKAE